MVEALEQYLDEHPDWQAALGESSTDGEIAREAVGIDDSMLPKDATRADEQAVGMAVIAALELQHAAAPADRPGQTDRTHRGLGARRAHPDLLHARNSAADRNRELRLDFSGRTEAGPTGERSPNGASDSSARYPIWTSHSLNPA